MSAYATVDQVMAGFRELDADEQAVCAQLLEEAGLIIDAAAPNAAAENKALVSCRMVRRAMGDGDSMQALPLGSTQGSIAAGGYTQSWTISGGSSGELYLGKTDRLLLGVGNRIGARSPLEGMVPDD